MLFRTAGFLALASLYAAALPAGNTTLHTELQRKGGKDCDEKQPGDAYGPPPGWSNQALVAHPGGDGGRSGDDGDDGADVVVVKTIYKTITMGRPASPTPERPPPALAAVPTPKASPKPSPKPKSAPANNNDDTPAPAAPASGGGGGDERQRWLDAHNAARAQYGAAPVTWDAAAEKQAAANADMHKGTCQLEHTPDGVRKFGENLAMSSGGSLSPESSVKMYMDEAKDYNWNSPGFTHGTGHFTQVVWKGTKGIGCVTRRCDTGGTYTACGYNPAGNMGGAFPQNVGRKV